MRAYLEDIRTFVAEQNERLALADSIKSFSLVEKKNRATRPNWPPDVSKLIHL